MTCGCQRQRQRVIAALRRGQFGEAWRHILRGLAMILLNAASTRKEKDSQLRAVRDWLRREPEKRAYVHQDILNKIDQLPE